MSSTISKPKLPDLDSTSSSKYKSLKELSALIRRGKRDSYPGIPVLDHEIEVEDGSGIAIIEPDGMDWLELSLLVMHKHVTIPAKTQLQLIAYRVYIPESQEMH